jgi:cell division protein FtsX
MLLFYSEKPKNEPPTLLKYIQRGVEKIEGLEDVSVDEDEFEALGIHFLFSVLTFIHFVLLFCFVLFCFVLLFVFLWS